MATIKADFSKFRKQIRHMSEGVESALRRELAKAMTISAIEMKTAMVRSSPRWTGKLANSHAYTPVDDTGGTLRTVIFNRDEKKAIWLHDGTRHERMPPPRALERWVQTTLGVPPKEVASVAFLVARSIKRKGGLHARKWMETAFRAGRKRTNQRLKAAIGKALKDEVA